MLQLPKVTEVNFFYLFGSGDTLWNKVTGCQQVSVNDASGDEEVKTENRKEDKQS